jgi:hypothetical protein
MYRCNGGAIESALFLGLGHLALPHTERRSDEVWEMQMPFGIIQIPTTNEWRLTAKEAYADFIAYQERALHQHEATAKFYLGLVDNCKAAIITARLNMEPNVPHNPNCDGDKCEKNEGIVKVLPTGPDSNAILCFACYLNEMAFRRSRIADGVEFDLPSWDSLKIYNGA